MDFNDAELSPLKAAALLSADQMFPDDEDDVRRSPDSISLTPTIAPSRDSIGRPARPFDMSQQTERESPTLGSTGHAKRHVRAAGNTRNILQNGPANREGKTSTVLNVPNAFTF
ncbi:hypothetical protein FGB62_6g011 [Gracilaria domingensis]|nr:hypothetical protein FGB62_6g011 [Gracilaria domingensis]